MRHPFTDRAIAEASVDRALEWWVSNPTDIRRPEGSSLHKLVEDWKAGIVVVPQSALHLKSFAEDLILSENQVFLVQHDWAGALRHVIDFETLEYRLPFEHCAFEFNVSGHRVIHIEHEDVGSVLAVHSVRHWCVFPLRGIEPPLQGREVGLASIFQIAAENVRAMTVVLDAEAAGVQRVEAPAALNRARVKSRRPLISDYRVVDLSSHQATGEDANAGLGGASKRLHFRRGHWRHFDGGKTWIRWTLAGNGDLGFVDKRYKL